MMVKAAGRKAAPSRRERILDAAEALFALHGYDGVTLRQIAKAASVDVALANYHFGRKRDLFEAVFDRRAKYLNDMRLGTLRRCQARAGAEGPPLEEIIAAFVQPLAALRSEADQEGWRNYLALVAYINNSPVWGREMMSAHFNPLVEDFVAALEAALPGVAKPRLYWGMQFMSGALTLTFAQTGRIDALSGGLCRAAGLEAAHAEMIPFIAGGFRALLAS